MIDCSLSQMSAEISAQNMIDLAIQDRDANHYQLVNKLTSPTVSYIFPGCQCDYDRYVEQYDKESVLVKGMKIDKNSCIYKRPDYGIGSWENQFNSKIDLENKLFNITTKAKMLT
jgi:hypothetical protein